MKFVGFSFLVSEYKIISGGVRKVIYWSFNWYMFKCIHHFSGKLVVLFTVPFFFRDRLDIAQKFPNDGRASHNKISSLSSTVALYYGPPVIFMNYIYPHGSWARICIPGFFDRDSIPMIFFIYILKVSVIYD